jgi:hypothetical protein
MQKPKNDMPVTRKSEVQENSELTSWSLIVFLFFVIERRPVKWRTNAPLRKY